MTDQDKSALLSKLRAEGVQAQIKRYYHGTDHMQETASGDWVRYDDHVAALASAPVAREAKPSDADIEQMAVNRYRQVPDGAFSYKVVAGDGTRSLYTGTKDSCLRVAAKLAEAFLDGAFAVAHAAPQASAEPAHKPGMSVTEFCAEAGRLGLTADTLAAQLSQRPEFSDCLPQADKNGGDCAKGAGDDAGITASEDVRDTGKDRLAFHIWALVRGFDITLNDSCGYQSPLTQRAWMRWNPPDSAALSAQPGAQKEQSDA